jgi:hypothetical protein
MQPDNSMLQQLLSQEHEVQQFMLKVSGVSPGTSSCQYRSWH